MARITTHQIFQALSWYKETRNVLCEILPVWYAICSHSRTNKIFPLSKMLWGEILCLLCLTRLGSWRFSKQKEHTSLPSFWAFLSAVFVLEPFSSIAPSPYTSPHLCQLAVRSVLSSHHFWQSIAPSALTSLDLRSSLAINCPIFRAWQFRWLTSSWNWCCVASRSIRCFRHLSSSPLPYTVFAPTLFEFEPTKSSSPPDWVMSKFSLSQVQCTQLFLVTPDPTQSI